jgi:branched-chain amino acid transport system ATP-binding protein
VLTVSGADAFYGDLQALRGVDFQVAGGEIVSVVGSNGAGKTTALRMVSGVLPPARGRVEFDGVDITRAPPPRIVEMGVSHVPEGRQLFPTLTVRENLEMGAQFPRARGRRARTMEQVFAYFPRLAERTDQKAGTLSGGEQQMVAIGRGLMSLPRLLMLDEPSLGLAPLIVRKIFEIIELINREGTAILLIEQNVKHALGLSNRGYVLENGEVVMSGPSAELAADPSVRETYLGLASEAGRSGRPRPGEPG